MIYHIINYSNIYILYIYIYFEPKLKINKRIQNFSHIQNLLLYSIYTFLNQIERTRQPNTFYYLRNNSIEKNSNNRNI